MNENRRIWDAVRRPPEDALKRITGGRLAGKSDINPQWRLEAMTEQLGPVGIGWRYEIVQLWTEPAPDGQTFAFARVDVFTAFPLGEGKGMGWNCAIPGIGGAMLVEQERGGLHANDEAFKMAVTDALSVALKALGVAADVYRGRFDGTKYRDQSPEKAPASPQDARSTITPIPTKEGAGKSHHSPERRRAAGALFAGLDHAFGEGKPWEDARKLRVLDEVFGTKNVKAITAMSNEEFLQRYTDHFDAVLEAAIKATQDAAAEEPQDPRDESSLPF